MPQYSKIYSNGEQLHRCISIMFSSSVKERDFCILVSGNDTLCASEIKNTQLSKNTTQ